MINPQFIKEYSALTTQSKWQELRAVFAVINDIGDRLQLLEQIIDKNQLDKVGVKDSTVASARVPVPRQRSGDYRDKDLW